MMEYYLEENKTLITLPTYFLIMDSYNLKSSLSIINDKTYWSMA